MASLSRGESNCERTIQGNVLMTYDEWFEDNQEELESLLRGDQAELVYKCWLAGYEAGLKEMGSFAADLFSNI